ncbi:hypothetical protein OAN307_c41620 [Octadecabacter antarcticus 307]|uniref:Uncharacterized protein n=1 Tax=Octadecabacter antarcticus 307 TaxID=391626 RepID=M9RIA6_9RHOB|nr:hypothetical protein [Octadecabacter antarcticus]AGI69560.1 hypothetical protein OAN307_c41620 [Octadecabacter antarcticus 307]
MTETYTAKKDRFDRADQLGLAFMRTLILLNGGAILSVLTFLGNASSQTNVTIQTGCIISAMIAFLVAIVAVLLGLGVSYTFYAINEQSSWSQFWNNWIVPFNAVMGLTSLFGFTIGLVLLLLGVELR